MQLPVFFLTQIQLEAYFTKLKMYTENLRCLDTNDCLRRATHST